MVRISTKMATRGATEAPASNRGLYFGYGTDDEQNPVSAFDVLRAELAAEGRPAVFERQAMVSIFRTVLDWFGLTNVRGAPR